MAGGGDRPKGGDGEKTKAKVRREGHRLGAVDTVLCAAGSADGGRVGGETLTVSVMRLDVGGGGDVKRLDLDHGPDARRDFVHSSFTGKSQTQLFRADGDGGSLGVSSLQVCC